MKTLQDQTIVPLVSTPARVLVIGYDLQRMFDSLVGAVRLKLVQ